MTRIRWVQIVVPVAYVCGILMSRHLWFDLGRSFPRAPIVPGLILQLDFVISILLLGTLVLSAVKADPRRYLVASVVLTAVLVFLDQTRLQPWVYQYAIMLALLSFAHTNQRATLAANQIVVAMLYFWSGLHKLSWTFIHEVVPTLVESSGFRVSPSWLTIIAVTIAICESMIGIGLLIRRTRRVAVIMACVMHAIVLFTFILSRRNSVIWPWNVAMIVSTVMLFMRNDETPLEHLRHHLPKAAMFVCGLLPALSFVGWWDLYLSGALYTGRTPVAVMRINESLRDRLPETAKKATFSTRGGEIMLPFYEWSLTDLNVPPYPEVRVYREVARQLCALDPDVQTNALIVRGQPALRDGKYQVTLTTCADLATDVTDEH